jgi:hypothetical protein
MNSRLRDIERLHAGLLAATVCAAWLTGWFAPASVLLGGAVMGLNFWLMRQLGVRLLTPARADQPGLVMVLMLAKFVLLLGIIAALFWRVQLDLLGFAVGATVLLVACVLSTLRAPQPALS